MASKASALQTGSVVLIQGVHVETQKKNYISLVSSDGFASQAINLVRVESWVTDSTQDIRNCLFQITQKLNYTAAEDYRGAKRRSSRDASEILALQEKMELEKHENDKLSGRDSRKEDLAYGMVIQLMHVKSGKFLALLDQFGAVNEKDCRRLSLDDGGEGSYFKIHPLYKAKQLGEQVMPEEPLVLLCERLGGNWQMHYSEKTIEEGAGGLEVRECNLSTRQCGWRMSLFDHDPATLSFGNIVKFFQPQHDGYVTASSCMIAKGTNPDGSLKQQKPPYIKHPEMQDLTSSPVSAKGLWVIEQPDKTQGLNVFETSFVAIRHLASGRYLAIDTTRPIQLPTGSAQYGVPAFETTLAPECDPTTCIFQVEPLRSREDAEDTLPLPLAGARVFLKQHRKCVTVQGETDLHIYLHCSGDPKPKVGKTSNLRGSLQLYGLAARLDSDALSVSAVLGERALQVEEVISYRQSLAKTMRSIETLVCKKGHLSMVDEGSDDVQRLIESDEAMREVQGLLMELRHVLEFALNLLTVRDINEEAMRREDDEEDLEEVNLLELSTAPDSDFQQTFRETKTMDVLFEVAAALWRTHPRTSRTSKAHILFNEEEDDDGKKSPIQKGEGVVSALSAHIHNLVFKTITYSFLNSRRNENYVEKNQWIPLLLERMAFGVGAENCFSNLISNNEELLKQKIDIGIIEQFVNYITDLGPDADFLEFMRSCCSCLGRGITSMQELSIQVIYDPGPCATKEDKEKYGSNRKNLLLNFELSRGPPVAGFPENIDNSQDCWGEDVLKNGIRDILVSWNQSENTLPWDLGQSYLYHSPQAMGFRSKGEDVHGRTKISFSELVWVLDPVECYHLAHGKGEEAWVLKALQLKEDGAFKRLFDAQTILAKYALQQILLMKEMCMNRSLNCIEAIEKEWPASTVVSGIFDKRLPQIVCSAFADLACVLHIDRLPHIEMQLPSMVRVLNLLPAWPEQIPLPQRSIENGHRSSTTRLASVGKFAILELAVKLTFQKLQGCQTHEARGQNSLVVSLTEMTEQLIRFGFFTSFETLHAVSGPIAQVLDGRPDRLREKRKLRHNQALISLSNRQNAGRSKSKEKANQSVPGQPINAWSDVPGTVNSSPRVNENSSKVLPVVGATGTTGSAEAQAVLEGITVDDQDCDFDEPEDRHLADDDSLVVMSCKQNMAEVLIKMLGIGTDVFFSRIVQRFMAVNDGNPGSSVAASAPQSLIDDVLEIFLSDTTFKMDKISGIEFNPALVDLMMYESDVLFERALTLMYESNNQLAVTLAQLPKLQILSSQNAIQLYDVVKRKSLRLELLLTSHEAWGFENNFSGIGREEVQECNELLVQLRQLLSTSIDCGNGAGAGAGQDTIIPDTTVQNICRSIGLVRVILVAFSIPRNDKLYESELESDQILHKILTLSFQLLMQYVRGHTLNQQELFDHIDVILPCVEQRVNAEAVITETFRNNIQLSEELPPEIFEEVLNQIVSWTRLPRFLSVFDACLWVNKAVCPRAKYQLIQILGNSATKEFFFGPLLSFFSTKESESGARDLTVLDKIKAFSSEDQLAEPLECFRKWKSEGDAEIVYLIKLVDLLTHLADGRDPLAESLVQSIMPAKSIALGLMDLHQMQIDSKCKPVGSLIVIWDLKRALLSLLDAAFFDSSLKDEAYAFSSLHTMLCRLVTKDIEDYRERVHREGIIDPSKSYCENSANGRYICEGVVAMLSSFFENMFKAELVAPHLQEALPTMITALTEAYSQMPKETHVRNELKRCGEIVRRAAGTMKRSAAAKAAAQTADLSSKAGSDFGGKAKDDIEQERLHLMRSLSTLDEKTVLFALEAANSSRDEKLNDEDITTRQLQHFAKALQSHPSVRQQMKYDHRHMVQQLSPEQLTAGDKTTRSKASQEAEVLITRERVFCRLIDWCQRHSSNYFMVQMVLRILIEDLYLKTPCTPEMTEGSNAINAVLEDIGNWDSKTRHAFEKAQTELARWGVVKLIVFTISSPHTPSNLLELNFEMAELILAGGNADVQKIFQELFSTCDEAVFFDNLYQLQIRVTDVVKPFRKLKDQVVKVGHADPGQFLQIVKSQHSLKSFCDANKMLQLLCENHNNWMQNYLRYQSDNTKSVNMLEQTNILLSRLCANAIVLDQMDAAEATVVCSGVELLVEMLQGPCEANQEYVAGTSIIDTFMKLCKAKFKKLCKLEVGGDKDTPPKLVRKLKGLIFVCLNAMLEGRTDLDVHKPVALWLDPRVLKERIIAHHTFFMKKYIKDQGKRDPSAEEPSEAEMQSLLSSLSEEDMEDLFQEPLELMTLVRAISDTNTDFKNKMEPIVPSLLDKASFADEKDYDKAYNNYKEACKYLQAFTFFRMQVRGIEIVLPSQRLSMLYFRKPVAAWYLLQSTKLDVLKQIDLSTDDGKIAGFVEVISDLFVQVRHTQTLAEWKLPGGIGPLSQPFQFFLARDSKNLVRLNQLTLLLSSIICLLLIFTIGSIVDQFAFDSEDSADSSDARLLVASRLLKGGGGGSSGSDSVKGSNESVGFISEAAKLTVTCLGACYVGSAGLVVLLSLFLYAPVLFAKETVSAEEESEGGGLSMVIGCFGCLLVLGSFATSMHLSIGGDDGYNPWPLFFVFYPVTILTHFGFSGLGGSRPAFLMARVIDTIADLLMAESVAPRLIFMYFALTSVLTGDPFYYALLLFDVIFISPDLRSVIDAVIRPLKSLLLMLLLMLIVLFAFAFRILLSYRGNFQPGECDGLASCFVYTVYRGTTFGDGLGDYLGRENFLGLNRAAFDYLFFWVFTILIFSMVSGVIIDTFGAIRDEQDERKEKLSNFCFISGLPAEQIDKAGRKIGIPDGFREHIEYHQNKWDYASFIFYIQMKNPEDCTGLESYANELLAAEDNRWIPSSRSMFMEQAEEMGGHIEEKEEEKDRGKDSESIAQLEASQEKLTSTTRDIDARLRIVSQEVAHTNEALQQLLQHHGIDMSPLTRRNNATMSTTMSQMMAPNEVPMSQIANRLGGDSIAMAQRGR